MNLIDSLLKVNANNFSVRNFKLRCALIRDRTREGGMIHDGFRRLAIDSNALWGLEGKVKIMFPQLDEPAHFIFIGITLKNIL